MPAPERPSTRRLFGSALIVVFVVCAVGCTSNSEWSADPGAVLARTAAPPDESAPLLFVARSSTGSLHVRPDGESTLDLDAVGAMTWFTDRPARDAGTTSVTDALATFGWEQNGDPLGDDAPNGALIATELGADAVIIELLTATVDGNRVSFTVEFIGEHPESAALTDVELFIDDSAADPYVVTPSGLELLGTGGVVLGQTTDGSGQSHEQVLHLAPGTPGVEQSVMEQDELFAVVSGTTTYSVSGDMAVDDWRFGVDPTVTGSAAPIIVLKFDTGHALADLAADPAAYTASQALVEDQAATTARLTELIAFVISSAGPDQPDNAFYSPLANKLQNPNWSGVLIFNTSVTALPGEVNGQSTAALANTPITAVGTGFTVNSSGANGQTTESFFATIDYPGSAPGSASTSGTEYLRALFTNGALTEFDLGN